MKRIAVLMAVALLVLASGSTASAAIELITNGSFENGTNPPDASSADFHTLYYGDTSITGWTVLCAPPPPLCSIDWIGGYWQAADGVRSLDLAGLSDGGVALSQAFSTVIGQEYVLKFAMAGNPDNHDQPIKKMVVTLDGFDPREYTFDIRKPGGGFNDHGNMGWTSYEWRFTADTELTTLQFENVTGLNPDDFGAALDAVSVAPVPEPASLVVWSVIGAAAGLGAMRRRRRARWSEENRNAICQIIEQGHRA